MGDGHYVCVYVFYFLLVLLQNLLISMLCILKIISINIILNFININI